MSFYKKGAVLLVLLLVFCQTAFAQLTIKYPVVKDIGGYPVSGGTVQMVIGGEIKTLNAPPYATGVLHTTQFPATGGNGVSNLIIQDLPLNTTVYVKAWKTTPAPNNYYGFYGPGDTLGASVNIRWDDPVIVTDYKAAAPYTPEIVKFEEATTTIPNGSSTSTLKVFSAQPAPTDGKREVHSSAWRMYKKGDAQADLAGQTGLNISLDSSQVTPKTVYVFEVMHRNAFGDSAWAVAEYMVGGGVTGGGSADSVTYNLKKDPAGLGVNTFPLAYSSFKNPSLHNIRELVYAINAQAAANIVTAIGWWNADKQAPEGYMIDLAQYDYSKDDSKGWTLYGGIDPDPAKAPWARDMVVQVSVLISSQFKVTEGVR